MSTYTLWEATPVIARMPAERKQLPQLVNELFGRFIEDCGYTGYYTQPRRAGQQYFEFHGNTKRNKGYRVDIVMYYDQLDITVTRPPGAWHKLLQSVAYIALWIAGLALLIVLLAAGAGDEWPVSNKRKNKNKPGRWPANRFVVHEVAGIFVPDTTLVHTYHDKNAEEVVRVYFEFFKEQLEGVLKAEHWPAHLPRVNIFGN